MVFRPSVLREVPSRRPSALPIPHDSKTRRPDLCFVTVEVVSFWKRLPPSVFQYPRRLFLSPFCFRFGFSSVLFSLGVVSRRFFRAKLFSHNHFAARTNEPRWWCFSRANCYFPPPKPLARFFVLIWRLTLFPFLSAECFRRLISVIFFYFLLFSFCCFLRKKTFRSAPAFPVGVSLHLATPSLPPSWAQVLSFGGWVTLLIRRLPPPPFSYRLVFFRLCS